MADNATTFALTFLGGAPFTVLYEAVKIAIGRSMKFRSHLVNLGATLGKIQPHVLQHIAANNVLLSIPNDTIQDLETKMADGLVLMNKLEVISMWNIRIWGDCCNCMKPNWTEQLVELEESLQRLLSILQMQQGSNVSDIMVSVRYIEDKQDDFDRRLLIFERRQQEMQREQKEMLRGQQDIQRGQQKILAAMMAEQKPSNFYLKKKEPSNAYTKATSSLGLVFSLLFNAVVQVKVESMILKFLLKELKHTLYCLQPLIQEIAKDNKVLHLPEKEIENFIVQMNESEKLVSACSKVCKYPYINTLLDLNKSLQGLSIKLMAQVECCVKESIKWTTNMEAVLNQIEGPRVRKKKELESEGRSSPFTLVPQPGSLCVGLDILNMQEQPRDAIREKLVDLEITENRIKLSEGNDAIIEEEGSCESTLEPPSPGIVQNLGVMYDKERINNIRLREEQDAAYRAALEADQARETQRREEQERLEREAAEAERKRKEEEEAREREAREAAEREAERARIRQEKALALGAEPEKGPDVTRVLVRFPAGERKERRFYSTTTIQSLYDYVDSLGCLDVEDYSLVSNFPRVVYGPEKANLNLKEAGLHPQASLFVELNS